MWLNPQKFAGLVTFTGEILNGKLHFFAVSQYCMVNEIFLANLHKHYCFRSTITDSKKEIQLNERKNDVLLLTGSIFKITGNCYNQNFHKIMIKL